MIMLITSSDGKVNLVTTRRQSCVGYAIRRHVTSCDVYMLTAPKTAQLASGSALLWLLVGQLLLQFSQSQDLNGRLNRNPKVA